MGGDEFVLLFLDADRAETDRRLATLKQFVADAARAVCPREPVSASVSGWPATRRTEETPKSCWPSPTPACTR